MSSSMAMWDYVPTFAPIDRARCARCGRVYRHGSMPHQRFCSEVCRKRAERARWKAKWKARGVNKYIGAAEKEVR